MAGTPMVTRESVPDCEREAFDAFVANRDEAPTTGRCWVLDLQTPL